MQKNGNPSVACRASTAYAKGGERDGLIGYISTDLPNGRLRRLSNSEYDGLKRRFFKSVSSPASVSHRYYYNGWNPVVEKITPSGGTTETVRYVWGKDLSGSLQGAGGVGGLLATQVGGAWYFPAYDANGNITQYVDEDGHVVASYTYDAFGNTAAQSGSMSSVFPFRFSTKYYDAESGLYYYGYRFYSPKLGRWLTRDPIEEAGGMNLYGFCGNEPSFRYDYRGLHAITDKTTGVEDCGVIVYATHIGNALELDLSNAKCRKVAFASCMSEQFLPTSRNYGLWNVIDGVPLSPGWVGDTRGEGANAGFGEGLAGFMAYMKSIFAIAKAEAESLCPPDRFLENGKKGQCKQCESYRANASFSRTDDFAFDRTLYNCCHCKSITLVFRSVLDKDMKTWSNILGSGEWMTNVGVFSNSSAKYDCKNKKWSGNKGFYSQEKLLPAQSPLEVTP